MVGMLASFPTNQIQQEFPRPTLIWIGFYTWMYHVHVHFSIHCINHYSTSSLVVSYFPYLRNESTIRELYKKATKMPHPQFEQLIKDPLTDDYVWIKGPFNSWKTTIYVEYVMRNPFHVVECCGCSSPSLAQGPRSSDIGVTLQEHPPSKEQSGSKTKGQKSGR